MKLFLILLISFLSFGQLKLETKHSAKEREGGGGGPLDYRILKGKELAIKAIKLVSSQKLNQNAPENIKEIYTETFRDQFLYDLERTPFSSSEFNKDKSSIAFAADELAFTFYSPTSYVYFDSNKANHFYYFDDFAAVWIHEILHHFGYHHNVEKIDEMYIDEEDFNLFSYYILDSAREIKPDLFVPKFLKQYIMMLNLEIISYNENIKKTKKEKKQKKHLIDQVEPSKVFKVFNQLDNEGRSSYSVNDLTTGIFVGTLMRTNLVNKKDKIKRNLYFSALNNTIKGINPNFESPKNLKNLYTDILIKDLPSINKLNCKNFVISYNYSNIEKIGKQDTITASATVGGILLGLATLPLGLTPVVAIGTPWTLGVISQIPKMFANKAEKLFYLSVENKRRHKKLIKKVLKSRSLDKSYSKQISEEIINIINIGFQKNIFCDGEEVRKYRKNYKWIKGELGL